MDTVLFELCAESLEAALAGESGGADRIELCAELACGGVTPDANVTIAALRALSIPVHILIRPRPGDFVFSPSEFDLMKGQIEQAKQAGATGVALGMLSADRTVDVKRSRALVELARPMNATFHRAFDETRDLHEALERVIETGANNLLTSGGAANVLSGAECLADLQRRAGGRINIIAGGGLRLESLAETVRRSGVFAVHGSLNRRNGQLKAEDGRKALEADIRRAVQLLHDTYREQKVATAAL